MGWLVCSPAYHVGFLQAMPAILVVYPIEDGAQLPWRGLSFGQTNNLIAVPIGRWMAGIQRANHPMSFVTINYGPR
jgi:hypothetical protein